MIKINIKINHRFQKKIVFAKAVRIGDIFEQEEFSSQNMIAYVLNCNYVPKDTLIESDATADCLTEDSPEGYRIYQDTTIFIMLMAFHKLYPQKTKFVVEHSIGNGVYGEMFGENIFTAEDVQKIKEEMNKIISQELPIQKLKIDLSEAERIFSQKGNGEIFSYLTYNKIEIYKCEDHFDYFLHQLAENTAAIKSFDLLYHSPGIILRFPDKDAMKIEGDFHFPRKLFATHQEHDKWLKILKVHNVSALNKAKDTYRLTDMIQIEEALHEKKIVFIADEISRQKDIKVVLIAGPSSSGKTTFAKRLSIHLRVNGLNPQLVQLDDYFLLRVLTPKKENGEYDFESLKAIDLQLLNDNLNDFLSGKEINLPKFNFLTGQRENIYRKLKQQKETILILEGIHVLNDKLTESVPFNQNVKIYVSALNNLNIDPHNRIPTTDSRKVRRIIRDTKFRGHSAEQTLDRWDSIRQGEDNNIFPFQENTDFMFNSTLTYELGVLKKHIMPLLQDITEYCPRFLEAKRLIKLLDHISTIQDELVPSNSILREFIGGSVFNY